MRVLVTGGAGFIGSNLVKILVDEGIDVNVLYLPNDYLGNIKDIKCKLCPGNVLDKKSLEKAIEGCQQVYHLAAIYRLWLPRMELMREVNVFGTKNMMEVCLENKIEKVVFTRSIARFGGQGLDKDATEESPFAFADTGDLYSVTKYESHQLVLDFFEKGLNVSIAAPCGPVGPGDYGPTPTGGALLSALNLPVTFGLKTITNLGDVRDIAHGHFLAMEKGKPGRSYLLGNENVEYERVLKISLEIANIKKPILKYSPYFLLKIMGYLMLLNTRLITKKQPIITPAGVRIMAMGLRADCSRAIKELGLPTRPIEESLRDAMIWFAENGYIKNKKAVKNILELEKEIA